MSAIRAVGPVRTRRTVRIAQLGLIVVVALGALRSGTDPIAWSWYLAYSAVGCLLAIRRPRNPIGWLLIAIGTVLTTQDVDSATLQAVANGTADLRATLGAWFQSWSGASVYVAYVVLAIVFPSGHLPVGRWRRPAVAAIVTASGAVVVMALGPMIGTGDRLVTNPVGLLAWLPVPIEFFLDLPYLVLVSLVALGVGSQVVRFRRATGALRQQLRWLTSAVVLMLAGVVAGFVATAFGADPSGQQWLLVALAYPLVPIAIGIAVLRYRLYAIDRIVSRTLAYAALTAILFGVFAVVDLAAHSLIPPVLGGGEIEVAVSTLAAAALFNPLRVRLQAVVDRRFNRARYDADQLALAFSQRVRAGSDLPSLLDELTATIQQAVEPARAGIWIRSASSPARSAA